MRVFFFQMNNRTLITGLIVTATVTVTAVIVYKSFKKNKKLSLAPDSLNPQEAASQFKNQGNVLFAQKNYEDAISLYSKSILLDPLAVYYNNRAACYSHLKNYEMAIQDCNAAISLNPSYIKALSRRASSFENLQLYQEALSDFSALCVLEEFKNQSFMTSCDRVLKNIATIKAAEIMKTKVERLPSEAFITAYLGSFRQTGANIKQILSRPPVTDADSELLLAVEAIINSNFDVAYQYISHSLESKLSEDFESFGYSLRGTFRFLVGNSIYN